MRALVLVLLFACDAKGTTPSSTGGLRGRVSGDADGQVGVIVDVTGAKKYEATTGDDGRYSIELPPGEYKVAITLSQCGKPKTVEVKAGEWIDLDWKCWIKTK